MTLLDQTRSLRRSWRVDQLFRTVRWSTYQLLMFNWRPFWWAGWFVVVPILQSLRYSEGVLLFREILRIGSNHTNIHHQDNWYVADHYLIKKDLKLGISWIIESSEDTLEAIFLYQKAPEICVSQFLKQKASIIPTSFTIRNLYAKKNNRNLPERNKTRHASAMWLSGKLGLLLAVGVFGEIDEFACWPSSRPDVEELRESCCDVSRSSAKILAQSSCFTGIHTYEILGSKQQVSQMRDFFPMGPGGGYWNCHLDQTTKLWNKISWGKRIKRVCWKHTAFLRFSW